MQLGKIITKEIVSIVLLIINLGEQSSSVLNTLLFFNSYLLKYTNSRTYNY